MKKYYFLIFTITIVIGNFFFVNSVAGCDPNEVMSCGWNAYVYCKASTHTCENCPSGYLNCDAVGNCEINILTDEDNCGSCGNQCDPSETCSNGVCTGGGGTGCDPNEVMSCGWNAYVYCDPSTQTCEDCPTGYFNCDSVGNNGCEINILTDEDNCGSCGNQCDPSETCSNGVCTGGGGGNGSGGTINIDNPLTFGRFEDIVNKIIDFIFKIAIVLAPLMIIVGAFLFVTSGGDLQKVSRAKNLMIWTVIGFVIVLLAKGLLAMLESILGVAE